VTNGPVDPEVLRRLLESMGGDEEFIAELIEQFLTDTPGLVEAARTGLETGDVDEVRLAAHTLKSNAATFGAHELAERSRGLEEAAKAGAIPDGADQVEAIAEELDRVREQLPTVSAGLSGGA
jgi:HPt (histidine-containing phosphotransfer) domain-containing protein